VQQEVKEFIQTHVQEYFSPEFRGRFGRENIIFFNHFTPENYRAIVRLQIKELIAEMENRGLVVTADETVGPFLAELAWQRREEGARPVRRLITTHLRDQLVAARTDDPQRTRFSFTVLVGSGQVVLED
jgi:ATP-dependent Clp protease ATP-binding subunit ClpA